MNRVRARGAWLLLVFLLTGCGPADPVGPDAPGGETSGGDSSTGGQAGATAGSTTDGNGGSSGRVEPVAPEGGGSGASVGGETPPPAATAKNEQLRQLLTRLARDESDNVAEDEIDESVDEVAEVASMLTDGSAEVRLGAAYFLLDRADLSDERIVSGFSRALSDDNQQVRHIALQVVQRFPDDTVIAQAAELAAMATNSQESVANRLAVIRRLQKLEQRAASGAAAFQKAAREDANLAIRKACVVAAARVSEPEEAVRFLGEFCATEKDVQLRRLALVRLGRSATPAAAPHLAAALGASEEVIREAAANGLVTLGGASTEPLRRRLSDKNPQTRQLAVYCLGKIGGAARAAVPDLQKRVDDESEVQSTRDLARLVIQSISQVP